MPQCVEGVYTAAMSKPRTVSLPATDGGRVLNFSPGPATIPEPVLRQAQGDLWDYRDTGVGIAEHSHRGPTFAEVIGEAESACRRLAGLDDEWAVLFLQGGATQQFATVPMGFLAAGRAADYLDTGAWTSKAIAHARAYGEVHVAFAGAKTDYDHTPAAAEIAASDDPVYTWYCSNNTIAGSQYPAPPPSIAPLVCDASSDIFSRRLDTAGHGLIFAGGQKNLGVAGCTLVLARRDFLARSRDGLPAIFDYRKHDEKGSCLNTPPTFAIYIMGLVLRWIEAEGGLLAMAQRNRDKASLIYGAIDRSQGFYRAVARPASRSAMNITFRTASPALDARLIEAAAAAGFAGLKGHRSVGGLRASVYNAFPASGCHALADFLADFARRNG